MDQEDVIKIFRDLPSTTQMKIRRSRTVPAETDSSQKTEQRKDSFKRPSTQEPTLLPKPPAQEPVPLPKPPENKRRSSLRNKVQPVKQEIQEDKPSSTGKVNGVSPSEHPKSEVKNDSSHIRGSVSSVADKARVGNKTSNGAQNTPESHSTGVKEPIVNNVNTNEDLTNTKSVEIKDDLGDNLIIPTGYRKMAVSIKKAANSTLGISLVPSYGKLKGYFQVIVV